MFPLAHEVSDGLDHSCDAADGNTGFGVKIDYIFVEERDDAVFRVEGASIRNDAPGGSDHFPVMAEVVLLSENL